MAGHQRRTTGPGALILDRTRDVEIGTGTDLRRLAVSLAVNRFVIAFATGYTLSVLPIGLGPNMMRLLAGNTQHVVAGMDGNRTHLGRLSTAPRTVLKTVRPTSM